MSVSEGNSNWPFHKDWDRDTKVGFAKTFWKEHAKYLLHMTSQCAERWPNQKPNITFQMTNIIIRNGYLLALEKYLTFISIPYIGVKSSGVKSLRLDDSCRSLTYCAELHSALKHLLAFSVGSWGPLIRLTNTTTRRSTQVTRLTFNAIKYILNYRQHFFPFCLTFLIFIRCNSYILTQCCQVLISL